ncbi:MAG TPA: mycothiol conjugate amidase Mca [Nitriliruptorales bacterium]
MTDHPHELPDPLPARRLLFVHAHPDDEASKGAATAARYVDEGARVVLVTCTGGEAGEVLNPNYPSDIPEGALTAIRKAELEASIQIIGFSRAYQLGYPDSGYHEDPSGVPEGTFARTSADVSGADLAAILRRERPQVVVTYPEDGGYPHPDHIMTHAVTLRAVELAADPDAGVDGEPWQVAKVYANSGFPPERVLSLHEALLARDGQSPFEGWMERAAERGQDLESDRAHCAAKLHVAPWFPRRDDALRAHATQVDPAGFWFQIDRGLEAAVFPWECFAVISSTVDVDAPEGDLFASLDL